VVGILGSAKAFVLPNHHLPRDTRQPALAHRKESFQRFFATALASATSLTPTLRKDPLPVLA
jgi:hypothetical protein